MDQEKGVYQLWNVVDFEKIFDFLLLMIIVFDQVILNIMIIWIEVELQKYRKIKNIQSLDFGIMNVELGESRRRIGSIVFFY